MVKTQKCLPQGITMAMMRVPSHAYGFVCVCTDMPVEIQCYDYSGDRQAFVLK